MTTGQEADQAHAQSSALAFAGSNYEVLASVPLRLSVEAGSTSLPLSDLLALQEGSVVELNRQTGEWLDIMVNGAPVAKGEVVTVDGRFGIRVTEVIRTGQRTARVERR